MPLCVPKHIPKGCVLGNAKPEGQLDRENGLLELEADPPSQPALWRR